MATITIRALDDEVKAKLRVRAAGNGRSMEAEVREILWAAVSNPVPSRFGSRIRDRFGAVGGIDFELPDRADLPRAADLSP